MISHSFAVTAHRPLTVLLCLALSTGCGGGGSSGGESPPPDTSDCLNLPAEIAWFRGPASNDWSDVHVDRQHRVWLAGYADGSLGTTNIEPGGNSRAVLRQLAADGTLLWESGAEFDTPGTDVAEALTVTAQGTVVAAGRTTGSFTGAANAGQFDTFVAWSDAGSSGPAWRFFQTGSVAPQHPRRLALAEDGDILIAGQDDIYVPTNYVAAWSDPFALRLGRQGGGTPSDRLQLRWQHQFATTVDDVINALAVESTAQGNATYVAGSVLAGPERGMFLRKLASDGRVLWNVRPGSTPLDNIAAIAVLPDTTLLIAGTAYGSFQGGVGLGAQDAFVARIAAADGSVLQAWQFGSSASEWLTDMKLGADGSIYLFGETLGSVAPGRPAAGQADLFLMKISPAGQLMASHQWGTPNDEAARHLAVDSCGHVVAAGSSTVNRQRAGLMWFWRPPR